MTNNEGETDGVWFVYDGECPICTQAARALRIKQNCGKLHIVDARTQYNSPLVKEINRLEYDLDEGMVIFYQGKYYHGDDALHFMAIYGKPSGFFNRINIALFKNKHVANLCYPVMRGMRNILLRLLGKSPIKNLVPRDQPLFKTIFKDSWDDLPEVMHKHYANRPFSSDAYNCKGVMDIKSHFLLRIFAPISHMLGGIPITNQKNIDVKVIFKSDPDTAYLHFIREFKIKQNKSYIFHSTMIPTGENHVTEAMKFGLCWRSKFSGQCDKVILAHNGYSLNILGKFFPLPITWLIGHIHAEEIALSDTRFKMFVEINHWLFGKIYEYRGVFEMEPADV